MSIFTKIQDAIERAAYADRIAADRAHADRIAAIENEPVAAGALLMNLILRAADEVATS